LWRRSTDKDPILEHLGGRFAPPPDPLGGVIERRLRRTRNRRIAGGAVGATVGILVVLVVLFAGGAGSDVPTVAPGSSSAFGTTGLRITIPPSFTTITSVAAYERVLSRSGRWGLLGDPTCWGSPAETGQDFVGAAYLPDSDAAMPDRRLLIYRTANRPLQDVVGCERDVRESMGGRLIQQADVRIDGKPGVRLVFRGGSYATGRVDLLYIVDDGAYRWVFEFTVTDAQAGALHQFDSIMLLSVHFP
jgi:uncharacterized protein YcfJ